VRMNMTGSFGQLAGGGPRQPWLSRQALATVNLYEVRAAFLRCFSGEESSLPGPSHRLDRRTVIGESQGSRSLCLGTARAASSEPASIATLAALGGSMLSP